MKMVINAVATSPGGGLTNLLGLLQAWERTGTAFEIVTIASNETTLARISDHSRITRIVSVKPLGLHQRIWWDFVSLPGIVSDLGAHVLLSNNFCSPRVRCPQVVHHQTVFTWRTDWQPDLVRSYLQRFAARRYSPIASWNVFSSHYLRRKALKVKPSLARVSSVVHFGVDHEVFRPLPYSGSPGFRLAALQTPAGYKDNFSLLQTMASLVERSPDKPWELRIAGGGDFSKWKALAHRLNIADRVSFLGDLARIRIARLLQSSDILIYPSRTESFGLPMLEGMACGIPVIAIQSEIADEVGDGAIVTVPPGSFQHMADAVERIHASPTLRKRLRENGLERASKFSWDEMAIELEDILIRAATDHLVPRKC